MIQAPPVGGSRIRPAANFRAISARKPGIPPSWSNLFWKPGGRHFIPMCDLPAYFKSVCERLESGEIVPLGCGGFDAFVRVNPAGELELRIKSAASVTTYKLPNAVDPFSLGQAIARARSDHLDRLFGLSDVNFFVTASIKL